MITARRVGAIVLAMAAVVVWFAMGPQDRSEDIRQALADYERNELRTEGAPQQQVVNGWVAKDLLTVIAEQQNDTASDERLPALAVLLVLGAALYVFTSPGRTHPDSTMAPNIHPETETPPVLQS